MNCVLLHLSSARFKDMAYHPKHTELIRRLFLFYKWVCGFTVVSMEVREVIRALELELQTFSRVVCTHNHWTIFPDPTLHLKTILIFISFLLFTRKASIRRTQKSPVLTDWQPSKPGYFPSLPQASSQALCGSGVPLSLVPKFERSASSQATCKSESEQGPGHGFMIPRPVDKHVSFLSLRLGLILGKKLRGQNWRQNKVKLAGGVWLEVLAHPPMWRGRCSAAPVPRNSFQHNPSSLELPLSQVCVSQ